MERENGIRTDGMAGGLARRLLERSMPESTNEDDGTMPDLDSLIARNRELQQRLEAVGEERTRLSSGNQRLRRQLSELNETSRKLNEANRRERECAAREERVDASSGGRLNSRTARPGSPGPFQAGRRTRRHGRRDRKTGGGTMRAGAGEARTGGCRPSRVRTALVVRPRHGDVRVRLDHAVRRHGGAVAGASRESSRMGSRTVGTGRERWPMGFRRCSWSSAERLKAGGTGRCC